MQQTELAYKPHACVLQRSRVPLELVMTAPFQDVDADVGAVAVPESTAVSHSAVEARLVVVAVICGEGVVVVVQ